MITLKNINGTVLMSVNDGVLVPVVLSILRKTHNGKAKPTTITIQLPDPLAVDAAADLQIYIADSHSKGA